MTPELRVFYNPQVTPGEATMTCMACVSLGGAAGGSANAVAVALALDRSFSMNRVMPQARRATTIFVKGCSEDMICAIIAFSDEARVLVERGLCNSDWKTRAERQIASLEGKGGTRMSRALEACIQQLERSGNRQKRIIFVTDGRNAEDRPRFEAMLEKCREKQIVISAWGLGEDWDEDDLLTMARSTGGDCGCVINPSDLAKTFQASLQELMRPRLSQLEFELAPLYAELEVREVVQVYPFLMPLRQSAPLTWTLGDLEAGGTLVLRLSLALPRDLTRESVDLARPLLRFRDGQQQEGSSDGRVALRCEATGPANQHPFVTHYMRQEEAIRLAEKGRSLWQTGERDLATKLFESARRLSEETGLTAVKAMIDNLPQESSSSGVKTTTIYKSSVLNLYRTIVHREEL